MRRLVAAIIEMEKLLRTRLDDISARTKYAVMPIN
jgi:hypothetical protein